LGNDITTEKLTSWRGGEFCLQAKKSNDSSLTEILHQNVMEYHKINVLRAAAYRTVLWNWRKYNAINWKK